MSTPESQLVGIKCDDVDPSILEKIAKQEGIPIKELRRIIATYFRANTEDHETLIGTLGKANEDAFTENLKPTLPNGVFRFFVVTSFASGSPKLNVIIDSAESTGISAQALGGDTLTTGVAYTFDVQTKKGLEYNLQATAEVTFEIVLVTELTP